MISVLPLTPFLSLRRPEQQRFMAIYTAAIVSQDAESHSKTTIKKTQADSPVCLMLQTNHPFSRRFLIKKILQYAQKNYSK